MKMKRITYIVIAILAFVFSFCKEKTNKEKPVEISWYIMKNNRVPEFSDQLALEYIIKQISFGPRNPNSEGHSRAKVFLLNELKSLADTAYFQTFTYPGYDGIRLDLANIIASFNPDKKIRIMLCAHWDTRPRSEKDKNPENRSKPVLGANDGASGVAVLLSIAHILKNNKVDFGVDIVFFDAEDYGYEGDLLNYSIGAKYFAQKKPDYINPQFAILLDMVGDKEAVFKKEPNSMNFAPDIVNLVWNLASELNLKTFSNEFSSPIYDDHIPLGEIGIKIINIIDSDLIGADSPNPRRNYWHTQNDNLENISKETLGEVGKLLTHLIYSIKFVEK